MTKWKVRCDDCGAVFTEIYPDGLCDSDESYSDPNDPKSCDCDSQYTLLYAVYTKEKIVEFEATEEVEWAGDGSPIRVLRKLN